MKSKVIVSLFTAALCLAGASLAFGGERMVVAEMFTNTSCGPCYPAELVLDRVAGDLDPVLALIRYHVWWPSSGDPYYQYNNAENTARNNYYGNNYAPHLFIDGSIDGHETYGIWEGQIETESYTDAELSMSLSGSYFPDSLAGYVTVRIIVESSPGLNNYKLRVALTESDIHWNAPNGISVHEQTFRDMLPSASGQGIPLVVGDSLEYTFRFTTPSPMVVENLQLVAFVQADQNRHIIQGTKCALTALEPTGVEEEGARPRSFALSQNYPNPFNAQTRIDFVSRGGATRLEVFDMQGSKVCTLLDKATAPGRHAVIWDGRNAGGLPVSSGIYYYRLSDGSQSEVKRMTLLK